jgi:hypothetical protein
MSAGSRGRRRGEGAFGAVVGIAILVVACIAAFKIIPLHIKGNDVFDAMTEAANFGNLKPEDKLRFDIFRRAQDAQVPLPLTEIKISRYGGLIKISAKYEMTVDVLGYKYRYVFDRFVEKPTF